MRAQKKGFASNLVPVFSSGYIIPGCRVLRLTVGCNSFSDSCFLQVVGKSFADGRLAGVAVVAGVDSCFSTVGVRYRCSLLIVCVGGCAQFSIVAAHLCLLCEKARSGSA